MIPPDKRLFRALAFLLLCACSTAPQQKPGYDILITGALVLDGTGAPGIYADVAVKGGKIAAVGQLSRADAAAVIDARGLAVAPGIIDIHSHSDYALLVDGGAESKIRQGVTTEIIGEATSAGPFRPEESDHGRIESPTCGVEIDWAALGEYFDRLKTSGTSVNVGSYVGSMTVRRFVMGDTNRPASAGEIERMAAAVEQAMREGALGVATALLGSPLTTGELIAMARAAGRHGGLYSTHIRDEGDRIFEALDEAFLVGREAGVPVDVLHLKIADRKLWGQMGRVLARFEQARAEGVQATANMYPYIAGQNDLASLVPPSGWNGGRQAMLERLRDPAQRAEFRRILYAGGLPGWYNHYTASAGWESMLIVSTRAEKNRSLAGMTMDRVIAGRGAAEPTDVLYDLLLEEDGSVPTIFFLMTEEDVRTAMASPLVSFGSDGAAVKPGGVLGRGKPHPRWYGTFPRILGKYVREEKVLPLETAILKMTWMNAQKIGLRDRGLVQAGMAADLFLFDPGRIADRATFSDPHQFPAGVEYVLVNGTVVLERGEHTGRKPGVILYGPGRR
ncbi:MAG: D-aminoacylase [Candidatus Glassbacteria bacterium]|nr:D-aminoacylase [Candidatus Glassbacteria bacterium]